MKVSNLNNELLRPLKAESLSTFSKICKSVVYVLLEYGEIDLANLLKKEQQKAIEKGSKCVDENFMRSAWQVCSPSVSYRQKSIAGVAASKYHACAAQERGMPTEMVILERVPFSLLLSLGLEMSVFSCMVRKFYTSTLDRQIIAYELLQRILQYSQWLVVARGARASH